MITGPPPSGTLMILFRDNFCPSFLVLDDTRYPLALYGCIWERGMRSWNLHGIGIGMGLISFVLRRRASARVVGGHTTYYGVSLLSFDYCVKRIRQHDRNLSNKTNIVVFQEISWLFLICLNLSWQHCYSCLVRDGSSKGIIIYASSWRFRHWVLLSSY